MHESHNKLRVKYTKMKSRKILLFCAAKKLNHATLFSKQCSMPPLFIEQWRHVFTVH